MRVDFVRPDGGKPERLVCNAEIIFEAEAGLVGLRLVGFTLWRGTDGTLYVTFPSRGFGAADNRKYYDYLRPTEGNANRRVVDDLKAWIVEEWTRRVRDGAL